jgi:hypothetical protein
MTRDQRTQLRRALLECVPAFPDYRHVGQIQMQLAARGTTYSTTVLAYHLDQMITLGRICRMRIKGYTRPTCPEDVHNASHWAPERRSRRTVTKGLSAQLKALNADYQKIFLRSSQNPLTTPE